MEDKISKLIENNLEDFQKINKIKTSIIAEIDSMIKENNEAQQKIKN